MRRWWLAFALVMASAVASAEPAPATERAIQASHAAETRAAALDTQSAQLKARYQQQLAQVDALKQEKASWRRDRELRASLADSTDTANQLAALDKQRVAAQGAVTAAHRALVAAIDVELAAGATGARADQLAKLRAQAGGGAHAPKKIVIPDAEIDPLADPEDLDAQARALRDSEQELAKQVAGLDVQARELAEVADVRKHHERAIDMSRRDDDQPLRAAQRAEGGLTNGGGGGSGSGAGPETSSPTGLTGPNSSFSGNDRSPSSTGSFEAEATIVLGDVVDHATIEGLARASRSGDPAQRADAAKKTAVAVRARLEMLAKKRAAVEARAKQLRGK